MLVVSDKRLVPMQINTTVLQGEDGQYYYLHRDLYDQLTILWDTYGYGAQINLLAAQLADGAGAPNTWPDTVQEFYETVPAPLKAAAPFLLLVQEVAKLDSLEDMCGALTVISMSLNLRRIPKVDRSIRAAITFSLHIREEYRVHWDRFFQENPEFGVAVTMPAPIPQYTQIQESPSTVVARDEETGDEEVIQFTSDPSKFDFAAMMDSLQDDIADISGTSSNDPLDVKPAPAATTAGAQSWQAPSAASPSPRLPSPPALARPSSSFIRRSTPRSW